MVILMLSMSVLVNTFWFRQLLCCCLITGYERFVCSFICSAGFLKVGLRDKQAHPTLLKCPWARLPIRPLGAWLWPLTSQRAEVPLRVNHTSILVTHIFAHIVPMKTNWLIIFLILPAAFLWFLQREWMYLYLRLLYLWRLMLGEAVRDYCNFKILFC